MGFYGWSSLWMFNFFKIILNDFVKNIFYNTVFFFMNQAEAEQDL